MNLEIKREALRVDPISTFLDRWKAPVSPVTRAGNMIFVAGLPPFDPETGEIADVPIERQSELIMEQMKLCLQTAGASLDNVMKCNVYCTSTKHLAAFNAVYARYFPARSAGADLRLHAGMVRPLRRRDRLHRDDVTALTYLAPLAGRGRIASAIRVRGCRSLDDLMRGERPLTQPSPRKNGARERTVSAATSCANAQPAVTVPSPPSVPPSAPSSPR
ncbi:enamine deaminase RidA (YjgF/YER057c/UK114 family) [Bradyrhizobium sp. F1.13.1]